MGLFDFEKEFGKKLFGKNNDAAEIFSQHIQESNPGVNPFSVAYEDGKVTLAGNASSMEAYEKAVLMAGKDLIPVTANSTSDPFLPTVKLASGA
jgi:hypothetical protein